MSAKCLTVGDLKKFIADLPDELELSLTISDLSDETYELSPDLTVLTDKNGTPTLLDFDIGDLDDLECVDPGLIDVYVGPCTDDIDSPNEV